MYKIDVTLDNGERQIIETENAVILFGDSKKKDICVLGKEGAHAEVADLITEANYTYAINSTSDKERQHRIAAIALLGIINGRKLHDLMEKEVKKMETEKALNRD